MSSRYWLHFSLAMGVQCFNFFSWQAYTSEGLQAVRPQTLHPPFSAVFTVPLCFCSHPLQYEDNGKPVALATMSTKFLVRYKRQKQLKWRIQI